MLYDPKWEGPSISSFIGWLEMHDPKKKYDFHDCNGGCLVGQYMQAMGIEWGRTPSHANRGSWEHTNYLITARKIFGGNPGGVFRVLTDFPRTFGGALKRARQHES